MPPSHNNKEIKNDLEISNSQDLPSYLTGINALSFFLKKTERLAAVVYLITNLFSESEPLRTSLREDSIKLLNKISVLHSRDVHDQKKELAEATSLVRKISSLFEVLHLAGLISDMNHTVVSNELHMLFKHAEVLESQVIVKNSKSVVPNDFFSVSVEEITAKENKNLRDSQKLAEDKGQEIFKDIAKNNIFQSGKKEIVPNMNSGLENRKNHRQELIIALIKKKKEVTIKDLFGVVNNCSSKTIQRELLDLVKKNVLKKTGERRWSRYSLNN
ncbi:MAG: hypothetical protein WCT19_02325 [Candidatus Paceibacterota bacterium]|jgi:predicted transcriptional regulator